MLAGRNIGERPFKLWRSIAYPQAGQSLRRRRHERTTIAFLIALAIFSIWPFIPQRYDELTTPLPCQRLPGANDAVVIMKTGVTELEDRLPVHLNTTLKCPPNYVIFSDHEELYRGEWRVRDVLANVNPMIQQNNADFEIYRRVKEVGREGLEPAALTGERSSSKTTKEQKVQIAGWVLDKWKFLPMMNETFHLYPDHKWYVFIETDTYLFWSTTLKYLSTLDPSIPLVLGHRSTVKSEFPFMHGGSGYVVSNAALRLAVEHIAANSEKLDAFIEAEWAGDIALGVVFKDAGIPLTATWPMYQPHFFGVIDFGLSYEAQDFWCTPAGSFHHMTPEAVEDMWHYEQNWIKEEDVIYDPYTFIRHGDVLNDLLLPRMRFARYDWDNQCNEVEESIDSIDDCKSLCLEDDNCLQYLFNTEELQCRTLDSVRFGEAATGSGLFSDWIFERVERWRDSLPPCHGKSFPHPEIAAKIGPE